MVALEVVGSSRTSSSLQFASSKTPKSASRRSGTRSVCRRRWRRSLVWRCNLVLAKFLVRGRCIGSRGTAERKDSDRCHKPGRMESERQDSTFSASVNLDRSYVDRDWIQYCAPALCSNAGHFCVARASFTQNRSSRKGAFSSRA